MGRPRTGPAVGRQRRPPRGRLFLASLLVLGLLLSCGPAGESPKAERPAGAPSESAVATAPDYERTSLPFVEGAEPFRAAFADLNGDGRVDLAVCGTTLEQGFIRLYLAAADGSFETRDLEVPPSPRDLVLVDLDGDGALDLATASRAAGRIVALFGDGKGGFEDPFPLQLPHEPFGLAAADLDQDGRVDLIGVSEGGPLGVYENRGRRRFHSGRFVRLELGAALVRIVDPEKKGALALLVPIWRTNRLAILRPKGFEDLGKTEQIPLRVRHPFGVAAGDLDGDGIVDLVVPDLRGGPLEVLRGLPDGSFEHGFRLGPSASIRDVQVADLDRNGRADIVATSTSHNEVLLLYGQGQGRFATRSPLRGGMSPRSTAVADLDGDGFPDLVTANLRSHNVTLFRSQPARRVALREVQAVQEKRLDVLVELAEDYEGALAELREGNSQAAHPVLERIVETGRPLVKAGVLVPDPRSQEWLRYEGALLLLSDLHRYELGKPDRARDIETELAHDAEQLGFPRLAASQWLAVANIEAEALEDRAAAEAAYRKILELAEGWTAEEVSVFPGRFILDTARYRLDRLHLGEEGYEKRLAQLDLPYRMELARTFFAPLIIPHTRAYGPANRPLQTYLAFSEARPGTYRGAFAHYAAFLLALTLGENVGDPDAIANRFFELHPESLLAFSISSYLVGIHRDDEVRYAREVVRVRTLAKRYGFSAEITLPAEERGAAPESEPAELDPLPPS